MGISQETLKNLDYLREFRRTNKVKQSKIAKGQAGIAIPVASSITPEIAIPAASSIIPEVTITGSTAGMLMGLPAALTAYSLIGSLLRPNPGYVSSSYDTLPPTRQAMARAGESDATRIYSRGPVAIPRYLEEAPTQKGEAQAEVAVNEKPNEGSAAQTPTTPQGNPEGEKPENKPENEPKEKEKIRKLVDKVLRRDGTTKDTPKDTPKETPANKQGSLAGRAFWETEGNNFGSSYKWRNAGRVPLYINYGPKVGGFIWDQMSFNPAKGFKKGVEFSQGLSKTDSISNSNKNKTTKGTNEVDSTSTISGGTTTAPKVGNYTVNFSDIQNMNRR